MFFGDADFGNDSTVVDELYIIPACPTNLSNDPSLVTKISPFLVGYACALSVPLLNSIDLFFFISESTELNASICDWIISLVDSVLFFANATVGYDDKHAPITNALVIINFNLLIFINPPNF